MKTNNLNKSIFNIVKGFYLDTPQNRKLGRVGLGYDKDANTTKKEENKETEKKSKGNLKFSSLEEASKYAKDILNKYGDDLAKVEEIYESLKDKEYSKKIGGVDRRYKLIGKDFENNPILISDTFNILYKPKVKASMQKPGSMARPLKDFYEDIKKNLKGIQTKLKGKVTFNDIIDNGIDYKQISSKDISTKKPLSNRWRISEIKIEKVDKEKKKVQISYKEGWDKEKKTLNFDDLIIKI